MLGTLTEDELRGLLSARESACTKELDRLEDKQTFLRQQLQALEDAKLAEELACFRDVQAIYAVLARTQPR
jgi:hypothetical protein